MIAPDWHNWTHVILFNAMVYRFTSQICSVASLCKYNLNWIDLAWWLLSLVASEPLLSSEEEPLQLKILSHVYCTDGSLGTLAVATGPVAQSQHQECAK